MLKKVPWSGFMLLVYFVFIPLTIVTWLPPYRRTLMVLICAMMIGWVSLDECKKVKEDKLKLLSVILRTAAAFLLFTSMLAEIILAPPGHIPSFLLILIPLILLILSIVFGMLGDILVKRRL